MKKIPIIILTIVIIICLTNALSPAAQIQENSSFEKLLHLANEKGSVRIIVKLDVKNIQTLTGKSTQYQTIEPGLSFPAAGLQADLELAQAIETTSYSVLYRLNGKSYQLNHIYNTVPYIALEVSPEALSLLNTLPGVLEIYEDKPRRLIDYAEEKKPLENPFPTGLKNLDKPMLNTSVSLIGAKSAWTMGYTGSGWYVAILDTGIRRTHQFFTGKNIIEACYSALGDCPNGSTEMKGTGAAAHYESTYDGFDHGTHVAGIAAGKYGSLSGVAKESRIIAVNVFSRFSAGDCGGDPCVMSYDSDQVKGLEYVYSLRSSYSIAAVNMSLGGGSYSSYCNGEPQKAAMDNLKAVRIATVVASGNEGNCGAISSPACIPAAVAVGASNDSDVEAGFSNWHPTLQELFAPGVSINSSTGDSDTSYGSWSGTSMATPHVTGAWALLRQVSSSSSVDDILTALQKTGPTVDTLCSSGGSCPRIQVDSAISELQGVKNTINITSPNGGESWTVNSSYNITWTSSGLVGNVKIELSTDNGNRWSTIIASTKNTGSYKWIVSNNPSTRCKIRIKEASDSYPSDTSDATFSITSGPAPTLTITSPNGNEKWEVGSVHNITWTTTGTVGTLKIYYSTNNGSNWTTVTSSTSNDGSYSWTVPNAVTTTCKIRISEVADGLPSDTSNAAFSIITPIPPEISLNRTQFNYGSIVGGSASGVQTLRIDNKGGGTLQWTALSSDSWIQVSPASGSNSGEIAISIIPGALAVGVHDGGIQISAPGASNTPQSVSIQLTIKNAAQDEAPIGSFDSPADGASVSGSIALTGWALDDVGIANVKIYRQVNSDLIYIGDAMLVEGARPDVESLHSDMPRNYQAGWGYMLLTYFLPNGGNGDYIITAIAVDLNGKQTTLGSKTITVNNSNAVKPFGAIDNPPAGGEISGTYRNSGWVLTPLPNQIPVNGSTINVYIDGVNKGHPVYNNYRADIAAFFPGLLNSSGAHAYFNFNSASLSNGVHTIYWTAADNAGNTEGIGSRYFMVQNTSSDIAKVGAAWKNGSSEARQTIEEGKKEAGIGLVRVIKGYRDDVVPQMVYPGDSDIIDVNIRELERVVIDFGTGVRPMKSLPIGSTLDRERGIFYWQPGPGFLGKYDFMFMLTNPDGEIITKKVVININTNQNELSR
ncbi:MAG: S8 family serine peptidase [Acidobacteria bacterium]|nr:S8 family serine peptidase [Acidobacteriota bacterium]